MLPEYRTRFAPSPTGQLHLGHAYSAILAADRARSEGGKFLLRIENTDQTRCRLEHEAAIFEILNWLCLRWPEPVLRQSENLDMYKAALNRLIYMGLCYPCQCSRADIRSALSAPQEGVSYSGPDGVIYPGTCRGRRMDTIGGGEAVRLNMARAIDVVGDVGRLGFIENGPLAPGLHRLNAARLVDEVGDIVLARRDIGTAAYHLAVVVDDAAQGITEVVRGADLAEATMIHRLLQALLHLPTPTYYHHKLIRDDAGKRLAKRDDAQAVAKYRAGGATPQDIRRLVGL